MKIIEKKCPNCGAKLEFNLEDKETKCKYCNSEFIIENNNENSKKINMDDIDLKFAKRVTKLHFLFVGIVTLLIIGTFIFIMFMIFTSFKSFNKSSNFFDKEHAETKKDEQSLKDITSEMDEKFSNKAVKELDKWKGYTTTYERVGEPEKVGFYYLKNSVSVKLIYVYKQEFSNGVENKTIYAAVSFVGISVDSIGATPFVDTNKIDLNENEYVYGYENIEDLYDSVINSTKSFNFNALATDGLYIEK